jgi:hypothetical protein
MINVANRRTALFLGLVLLTHVPTAASRQDRKIQRVGTEGRRLALVVGNNRYEAAPLVNAVNDARAVSAALESIGFAATLLTDGTLESMDRTVETFVGGVQPGDVALLYYSGHGVQISGENYLLPIDFRGADEVSLRRRSISVSEVEERLAQRGARVRILILDACRDNPFRGTRSGVHGLAQYAAEGALIAYATAPGSTASDNAAASNGLFTTHLLTALRTPGLTATELFRTIREQVRSASGGRQVPWLADGLIGDFVFVVSPNVQPAAGRGATTTGSLASDDLRLREELLFWESVRETRSPTVLQEYLRRYGDSGRFSLIARERLTELSRSSLRAGSDAATLAPREPESPARVDPRAPKLAIKTSAGLLITQVNPERKHIVDEFMSRMLTRLRSSSEPTLRQQANGMRVYSASEAFEKNALYIMIVDPVVANADYEYFALLNRTMSSEEQRAPETTSMWSRYRSAFVSHSLLSLTPLRRPRQSDGEALPASPGAAKLSFLTPAGMLLVQIKPDHAAVFEEFAERVLTNLARSADASLRQQGAGMQIYRASEPYGDNVLYVLAIDPIVANADYELFALLDKAMPAGESVSSDAWKRYADAFAAGLSKLSLTPVQ